MVDEGLFATTTEVQRKVGANASSTSNVEAFINQYMTEAESLINTVVRFNFSDTYSALNVDVKGMLKQIASDLAAIMVLNYDATAIVSATSLIEYEDRITVLRDSAMRGLSILKDQKHTTFIKNA